MVKEGLALAFGRPVPLCHGLGVLTGAGASANPEWELSATLAQARLLNELLLSLFYRQGN